MSTHYCEECRAVLDPKKVLRCTKCKASFYCSAACQKRNWKIHKRVCSSDPLKRRFVPVEMAVERVLAKQLKTKAPKEATCYICLEGDDGGKLMRGCACRGESAGFVHVECLTKLAMSKEASGDLEIIFNGWTFCGNCKQIFQDALGLEMARHCWKRFRSSQDVELRFNSVRSLATSLGGNGEVDAANQLLDEASTCVRREKEPRLMLILSRATILSSNGQQLEALGLLQSILPEAKEYAAAPQYYSQILRDVVSVYLRLHRNQEAHETATELVAFTKAKFGTEHLATVEGLHWKARTCVKLGRVEEAKVDFKVVLDIATRVFGRDHPLTHNTMNDMRFLGFRVPSG